MKAASLLLCLTVAVLPAGVDAAAICLFMNEATAAGILGGSVEVQATVTDKENGDAFCEFTRKTADPSLSLRIEVKTMRDPRTDFPPFIAQCGTHAEAVRGVGNEAVACRGNAGSSKQYDQILSRVRERSLLVRVATLNNKIAVNTLRPKTIQAADLVSGNLF